MQSTTMHAVRASRLYNSCGLISIIIKKSDVLYIWMKKDGQTNKCVPQRFKV
jgi:hypothetical protein